MTEKDLTVLRVKSTQVDHDDGLNPILPKHAFLMLLVAPPKRGKSNLVMNILANENYYGECNTGEDYFSEIWYFSPTCEFDNTTSSVIEKIENLIMISDPSDLSNLTSLIKNIVKDRAEKTKEYVKDKVPIHERDKALIVLDDCIGFFTKELEVLCTRYRHFGISIIITSQQFRKIPLLCRNCCNALIFFDLGAPKELLKIEEEFGCHYGEDFMDLADKAIERQYDFCFMNHDAQKLYKNFSELLRDNVEHRFNRKKAMINFQEEKQAGLRKKKAKK